MATKSVNISVYQEVSADVWKLFRKYHEPDADLNGFTADVDVLDRKYKDDELYGFMQKLFKVYFDELNKLKGTTNG